LSDLFTKILSKNFTKLSAIKALEAWEEEENKKSSKKDAIASLQHDVVEARKKIDSLEPLHLFLPKEIPDEELEKIANYLRESNKNLLLEIKIEPELLGGCALSYKGVYKDYSLKTKLTNLKFTI